MNDRQAAFSTGQEQWAALRTEAGFGGQCGGYVQDDPEYVQIFGLWTNMGAYQRFMNRVHDRIARSNAQAECYDDSGSALYELEFDMPGAVCDLSDALGSGAAMIRVARCKARPDRVDHFVEVQESVWMPGMKSAQGMLGGGFWRSVDDEDQFIVTTAWASMEDHERYCNEQLPKLRDQANLKDDLVKLAGEQVVLTPAWTVLP